MCRREFLIGRSSVSQKVFGLDRHRREKMKPKIVLITIAILFAIALGGITYAGGGGMGGGGMGGGGMGGGRGMMGGDHMMDFGKGYSAPPYPDQFNRYNRPDEPDRYGPTDTTGLMNPIGMAPQKPKG
jgi:hypothetical protein